MSEHVVLKNIPLHRTVENHLYRAAVVDSIYRNVEDSLYRTIEYPLYGTVEDSLYRTVEDSLYHTVDNPPYGIVGNPLYRTTALEACPLRRLISEKVYGTAVAAALRFAPNLKPALLPLPCSPPRSLAPHV